MKLTVTFTQEELESAQLIRDEESVCCAIKCNCDMDYCWCPLFSLENEEALKYIEDHLEEES